MTQLAEFVLPTVVFVFMIWKVLPFAVLGLRPDAISARFMEDLIPEYLTAPIASELGSQFEGLGFRLLGTKQEQPPLWARPIHSLDFANAQIQTFASLSILAGRLTYYYYTPFSDDGVVLTANQGFIPKSATQLVISVQASPDPGDLLDYHLERVSEFESLTGDSPCVDFSPTGRIQATAQFYANSDVRAQMRWQGLICAAACVLPSIWLFIPLIKLFRTQH